MHIFTLMQYTERTRNKLPICNHGSAYDCKCRVDWSRPAPAPVDLFAISSLTRIRGYGKDIPGNFEILGYPEDIPGFGYPRIILICFSALQYLDVRLTVRVLVIVGAMVVREVVRVD